MHYVKERLDNEKCGFYKNLLQVSDGSTTFIYDLGDVNDGKVRCVKQISELENLVQHQESFVNTGTANFLPDPYDNKYVFRTQTNE